MRSRRERGIALLVVLSTLTLVTATVADFQFNSRVDLELAINARDSLQAEYNALSALRLRAMLLRQGRQVTSAIGGMLGALGMDAAMLPSMGQMLEMVPIDCGVLSAITKVAASDAGDTKGGGDEEGNVFNGECSASSHSEHTKISLNAFANPAGNKAVSALIVGLLSNPAFERHFQEDDKNGTHAENPIELVGAIADWIDRDKIQAGNQVGDEDRYYTFLKHAYHAKNAPFDSLAELQMVHGVDDEMYDVLKDLVTVYANSTQIELATAPDNELVIGLIASFRPGVSFVDFFNHPGTGLLFRSIAEMRMLGAATFSVLKVATLIGLISGSGLEPLIDPAMVRQVFTDNQDTTWYRLEAEGRVGNATRRIRAVFQADERDQPFYYFRME